VAQMTIDPATISQLLGAKERVQLLDRDGKILGYYEPPMSVFWLDDVSEEELDRRESEPGGLTTAEAITYLKSQRQSCTKSSGSAGR
jgi:hypothetical protein